MMKSNQLKVGPELLSPSAESWLAYYIFAVLSVGIPGLGGYMLQGAGLEGSTHLLVLIGIAILFLISLGICIMCHLLGHIIDEIDELRAERNRAAVESQTEAGLAQPD